MKLLLTKTAVNALQPSAKRFKVFDERINGFGVRVTRSSKVFFFFYRFPRGRAGTNKTYTIGKLGDVTVDQAREHAEILLGDYKKGIDPMARLQDQRREARAAREVVTVEAVTQDFVARYAKRNRSWRETERILKKYVNPILGKMPIGDVRRSDVNKVLDHVEDHHGKVMANGVLAQLRKCFAWYATRNDDFASPVIRGMNRISPSKIKRDRVLTDDEIRTMWRALEGAEPPFKQLVRFLLLTAQRREEAAQARETELDGDVWTVPPERYKTAKANTVPLSPLALEQWREAQAADTGTDEEKPRGPFVFSTTNGKRPFSGFSKCKARLDTDMEILAREAMTDEQSCKTPEPVLKPWRLHDLRRSAKTLMARAGVRPDISERVLGHVISGVAGTYDRFGYVEEKRDALEKLSAQVRAILDGGDAKVIAFRQRGA